MNLTEIWSRLTPGDLTAASLTSEGVALGDSDGLLLLLDGRGEVGAEHPLPAPIRAISADPGGPGMAVACGDGEIAFLLDGRVAFRTLLEPGFDFVSIGPHGDYLLALSRRGQGVFLNRYGREMRRLTVPGGVFSAAIVRSTGQIVTVSRQGTLQGFTGWGKPTWRAELMRADGRISADERGRLILVPAMAYGVEAVTAEGRSVGAFDIGEAVRSATCSGDGETLLFATAEDRLVLLRNDASVLSAETFPAPISEVELSVSGDRALVTTSSGYAHMLAVSGRADGPLLELSESTAVARPYYLMKKRVYSPFSMLIQARMDFSPDGSRLAVAGDRRKVQVLDMEGGEVATRRYGGSLLDIDYGADGQVRVYATQAVFRFTPGVEGTIPEWAGRPELTRVRPQPDGSAVALTENGEVLELVGNGSPQRLFHLRDPLVSGLEVSGSSVAVVMGEGEVLVMDEGGEQLGSSGPWPAGARLLAASDLGFLVAVRKMLLLLSPDGEERWRRHLAAPVRLGLALPGAFLVLDESGTASSVTATGAVRRAFSTRASLIVPFGDSGEGPGFLTVEGNLLTAIHPDGTPRWRFRTPDEITFATTSRDGRYAGALAGLDVYVFPIVRDASEREPEAASSYLEFGDG